MFFELLSMKLLQINAENNGNEDFKNYSNTHTPSKNEESTEESNADKKDSKDKDNSNSGDNSGGSILVFILQFLIACSAIYVSFKRNNGFVIGPFLVACCYPTFYLLYALLFPVYN
jgi:hypothetical protein